MPWMLLLHISALLVWSATLLYLPLLATRTLTRSPQLEVERCGFASLERLVFTHLATPAALLTILAGTLVFLLNRTVDGWLIIKLTLVTGLVVCHTLTGWLVLRVEAATGGSDTSRLLPWCGPVLALISAILMGGIVWLVLAKPTQGWWW